MIPNYSDPKTKNAPAPPPPARDPAMDLINQNQNQDGFFGSFFAKKKTPGVLEAVSIFFLSYGVFFFVVWSIFFKKI